jgi:hypothetical protein
LSFGSVALMLNKPRVCVCGSVCCTSTRSCLNSPDSVTSTHTGYMEDMKLSDDVESAGWIRTRLGGPFGAVTRTVPAGYEAYARICHPARDEDGVSVTWSQVASVTGRHAHPLMQWHALVGSVDPINVTSPLWEWENPERGNLGREVLTALTEVLARHTVSAVQCAFCLWDGWGWLDAPVIGQARGEHDASVRAAVSEQTRRPQAESVLAIGSHDPILDSDGPRFRLSGRDYLLFYGPLQSATSLGYWSTPDVFQAQSPNLFWPADRAWCVATEIDFDSTLVAGKRTLIDALLEAPALDAWPVHPDDSLASDADCTNTLL